MAPKHSLHPNPTTPPRAAGAPSPVDGARAVPERWGELDGLRGLAIALVLWHHLVAPALPSAHESWLGWIRIAMNLAWCGVDLFFVLSGFLIGGILIDRRDSPRLVGTFYLRRAARILPLYYLTLAVALSLHRWGYPDSFQLFPGWVYGTFLTNFALAAEQAWDWLPLSVLWSLAIEEQFYLAAPWVARMLPPARLPWFAGGMALLALLLRLGLLAWFPEGHFAAHVLMPMRMDGLALGLLAAWMVRAEGARPARERLTAGWRRFLGLGALGIAALALLRPEPGGLALCLWGYSLLAVFFAGVVLIATAVRPPRLSRVLTWTPLTHLGRCSYFVYLWHALIGGAVIRWLGGSPFRLESMPGLAAVAAAIAATWIAAAFSWRYLEGPLVAWGHRRTY
jgi:peptidoglycan/LPS O-acetylase OafA/YrhL